MKNTLKKTKFFTCFRIFPIHIPSLNQAHQ